MIVQRRIDVGDPDLDRSHLDQLVNRAMYLQSNLQQQPSQLITGEGGVNDPMLWPWEPERDETAFQTLDDSLP